MPSNTKSDRLTEAFIRDAKPEAATRNFLGSRRQRVGRSSHPGGIEGVHHSISCRGQVAPVNPSAMLSDHVEARPRGSRGATLGDQA